MNKTTVMALSATAEILGAALSEGAVKIMIMDLEGHSDDHLQSALKRMRQDSARFCTGEILKRLPQQWPGAEEAWARFPRDETASACVCDEMLQAWGIASALDEIAGRMAFKEAYSRAVSTAMSRGDKPRWIMSMGSDPASREQATLDAVAMGRLPATRAQVYLPHLSTDELAALENQPNKVRQLSHTPPERGTQAHANLAKIRALLSDPGDPSDELP